MTRRDSFLEKLDIWGTFALANLFWILLALPLVTMPLATAGLFQVMSKWSRHKQPEFFHDFFGGIRRKWAGALLIGVVNLVVGGFVLLNVSILLRMDAINPIALISGSLTLFSGWVLGLSNLYAWSLLAVSEQPIRSIMSTSVRLALAHPLWSSMVLLAALIPLLASLVLPKVVVLFVSISLSALIICRGTWRIIRKYLPADELAALEARPT